jgi:hypothetical protein
MAKQTRKSRKTVISISPQPQDRRFRSTCCTYITFGLTLRKLKFIQSIFTNVDLASKYALRPHCKEHPVKAL